MGLVMRKDARRRFSPGGMIHRTLTYLGAKKSMAQEHIFKFGSDEWRLFGNALNEVLHGFDVPDFERVIGSDKVTLQKLLTRLHAMNDADEITLGTTETIAVRNALRETVGELGVEEFHSRTGYDFELGKTILAKLNSRLSE